MDYVQRNARFPRIQELDGLDGQNFEKHFLAFFSYLLLILIKSMKREVHHMIQELDWLEIVKAERLPHTPQCVDELEIQREFDMLLVKTSL